MSVHTPFDRARRVPEGRALRVRKRQAARPPMPHAARAWTMLALGLSAQTATAAVVAAPAFLIPYLHAERGLTLAQAGLLAAAPTLGMVLTLVAWGALTDRIGERWVLAGGLLLTAAAGTGAVVASSYTALGGFLVLVGMAAASSSSASGRVVVAWFPKDRRGLAMGVRQMSQPLGTTLAALTVPALASARGIGMSLVPLIVACVVVGVACAVGVASAPARAGAVPAGDVGPGGVPAGSAASANPYRRSSFLLRIHVVSALLVVPQYTLTTFGLVWLIGSAGWDPFRAGVLMGGAQFVGAVGRIGVGGLSDRLGSRVRLLRWVAVSACVAMLLVAAVDAAHWATASAIAFVLATTIAVADNGLAFTSVAEVAGPAWSGRALGVQNTGQFIAASAVGPVVGMLIAAVGFPVAFAVVALCPALAVPLVPRDD